MYKCKKCGRPLLIATAWRSANGSGAIIKFSCVKQHEPAIVVALNCDFKESKSKMLDDVVEDIERAITCCRHEQAQAARSAVDAAIKNDLFCTPLNELYDVAENYGISVVQLVEEVDRRVREEGLIIV